jgi:prepilin-type N-terminal cleavage/methylation domain-containing protein/prepilin-type processing-associated H-X9-DG protein
VVNLFFEARARNRSRSSGGFTLIEMLTVVTIIVLLVSLLIPSVVNIANMGYQKSCFHNMYKIGQLNIEYANTNNGYVVPANCGARDPNIGGGNNPYVTVSFDECLRELNTGTAYRTMGGANLYQCPAGPAGWMEMGAGYRSYPCESAILPLHPHDPDPPCSPTDGGSYVMNIHQNGQANWNEWDGASWVQNPNSTTSVGLKTSQWDDAKGTIFLFETWRNGGWQDPSCAIDQTWAGGPMLAAFNGGTTKGVNPDSYQQAITTWQEKHLGKANLLFCDGHGDSKYVGDTLPGLGIGDTILTTGLNYANLNMTTPTMTSCFTVRGMWTHAAGD